MPRAIWSGSISFGLVNIPVKLYSAVSRKTVSFNQVDKRTQARVRQKRVSEATGEEVPYEEIAKGYQLADGRYVLIDDDELAALDPVATRTIDIEEFVEGADIDPLFFDGSYLLAPDKATVKPYALLVKAMEDAGRVAIARFVMRSRQHLVAIRAVDGHLVASTLVYADEIVDPSAIPELEAVAEADPSAKELASANMLLESLSADWKPEQFEDTYREAVLDLIERKAKGAVEVVEDVEEAPAGDNVVDLLAALEASVAAAKQARKKHPTSKEAEPADAEEAEERAPAKKATKKRPAKKATAKKAPARKVRKTA